MSEARRGVVDETCCKWITFKCAKGQQNSSEILSFEPHISACEGQKCAALRACDEVFCLHLTRQSRLVNLHHLVGVDPPQRHWIGSFCLHALRKTCSQTPMPRHHGTSSSRDCLTPSVSGALPRTSSTRASSAKKPSCGDGPAENAATSEKSSFLRRSARVAYKKDSTKPTTYRADAKPLFTCTCLSRFARQQIPTTHWSFNSKNTWLSNELPKTLFIPCRRVPWMFTDETVATMHLFNVSAHNKNEM